MSEILNTMKIIKLQSWEEKFEKLIDSYRENEFTWLAGTQYTKAYGTALYWMCPTIVSSVVFFGCALTGSASLDAATIFTILATLRGMSDPVKMIPETISAMIQVKRSFDRIESFLIADELRIEKLTTVPSRDSNMCIKIQAGKFSWDPESAIPTLRNSDLEVQRGQKIAICGPVGAGKSSVLYAMLGEIPRSSGSVTLFGSIAYVSQASWIQSGTIRDNILYGKPVEETKYKRAVKACALDKDINNFDYGDLTEIGQRGLNMSGGQKQRIQLARAVYSDADIYLLDDPFSAVDAHTAATLFNVRWSNVYIMLRSHTLVLPFQTLDGVTAGLRYGCLTKELKELTIEKVEGEKSFRMEQCKAANLIEEKDTTIKHLEATVAANRLDMETLNSKMEVLHCELRFKEDDLEHFRTSKEMLETEKSDLLTSNKDFASKLDKALQEIRNLEDFANMLAAKLIELDKQSLTFSDKVVQLNSLYDSWFKMVQEEKDLTSQCAKKQYDHLHNVTSHVISEKNELLLLNKELNNNIIEVQKGQEFAMVQHAEECRLAEERIRMLESEAESNLSRKSELELLVSKSEEKLTLYQKQDLILKFTALEAESKDSTEILQDEIQKKVEEVNSLQGDIDRHMQHLYALEKQVDKLQTTLEEKEQLVLLSKDREKELEDKKAELQAALVDAESKLSEAKMQYDSMLESKQLELSRHLKELSQRNDQAINDIRRKFEVEMLESVTAEKEKADKVVQEMERKCDQKLAEHKEESHQYLMCLQEEHAALITRIQQEHSMTELNLKSNHSDELKRIQLQTDNELREKTTLLRHEHEVQIRALKCQHEDECRKLQEELDIQKSKEDRQRALLQLQWKVMSDKPPEDQEVNSKKNYSVSSTKVRNSDGGRRSQRAPVPLENEPKDSPYLKATQTPVSTLLKKVEKVNTGSVMSIPKHSRKVTHREYEVETSNGRTIIKRRKTKSTVMFEDPTKRKTRTTPKVNPPRDVHKGMKGGNPHPSNIGDLFSEGSLNPYADDPYAFD